MERIQILALGELPEVGEIVIDAVPQFFMQYMVYSFYNTKKTDIEINLSSPKLHSSQNHSVELLEEDDFELTKSGIVNLHDFKFSGDEKTYLLTGRVPIEIELWNLRFLEKFDDKTKEFMTQRVRFVIFLFDRTKKSSLINLLKRRQEMHYIKNTPFLFIGYSNGGEDKKTILPKDEVLSLLVHEKYFEVTLNIDCETLGDYISMNKNSFDLVELSHDLNQRLKNSGFDEVYQYISDNLLKRMKKPLPSQKRKADRDFNQLLIEVINWIESGFLSTSRIFEIDGDEVYVEKLYKQIKEQKGGKIYEILANCDTPVVTSLLKRIMNKLAEPIIPTFLHIHFASLSNISCNLFQKILIEEFFMLLVLKSNEDAYILLRFLRLLYKIVSNKERTHVDSRLLSKVMGQYLIRYNNNTPPMIRMQESLQFLLDNYIHIPKLVESDEGFSIVFSDGKKIFHHNSKIAIKLPDRFHMPATKTSSKGVHQFHLYAKAGNLDLLQSGLKENLFLIVAKDDEQNNLLHYAVVCSESFLKKYKTVEYLINLNSSLSLDKNTEKKTPLHFAIGAGLEVFELIMKSIPEGDWERIILQPTTKGKNLIHYASAIDRIEYLRYFLEYHLSAVSKSLTMQDAYGCTPLHYAVKNQSFGQGHIDDRKCFFYILSILMGRREEGDQETLLPGEMRDKEGQIPLHHLLSSLGDKFAFDMIEYLVYGNGYSTLLAADRNGRIPLHIAVMNDKIESVGKLINLSFQHQIGPKVLNHRDNMGKVPLHYAAGNHKVNLVVRLLNDKKTGNTRDYEGKSPLHYAVERHPTNNGIEDQIEVIEILVANSDTINAIDFEGKTPLHYVSTEKAADRLCSLGAQLFYDFSGELPHKYVSEGVRAVLDQKFPQLPQSPSHSNNSQSNSSSSNIIQ